VTVGANGTLFASLNWAAAPVNDAPPATTQIAAPNSTATATSTFAYGKSRLGGTMSWPKGFHRLTTTSSPAVPANGTAAPAITTDAPGDIAATLDYAAGPKVDAVGGTVPALGTDNHTVVTATGNGTISASISWGSALDGDLDLQILDGATALSGCTGGATLGGKTESISCPVTALSAYPASHAYTLSVKAKTTGTTYSGAISYPVTPTIAFALTTPSGTQLVAASPIAGQRRLALTYSDAPAGSYLLKATNSSQVSSSTTLAETHTKADFADLTLRLKDPAGTEVANVRSATGTASLAATVTTGGSYSWSITNNSTDLAAPYSLSPTVTTLGDTSSPQVPWPTLGAATVTVHADGPGYLSTALNYTKNSVNQFPAVSYAVTTTAGATIIGPVNAANGIAFLAGNLPAAGDYRLVATPGTGAVMTGSQYSTASTLPLTRTGTASFVLKNAGGTVASGSAAQPSTLSASVSPGSYNLVVTGVSGAGVASLSAGYPDRPAIETISYEGRDLATAIDDGAQKVTETLGPTGRVLRRVVVDDTTAATLEDITYGYADGSDSPVASWPSSAGALTSYVSVGAGLGLIDTAGAASYPIANGHGDIVGNTDAAGAFIPAPDADEFGNAAAVTTRLGWLGAKERFEVGGRLGLMRMGVRLYDPALGRFLEVDPIEGGSANDYDYVAADPENNYDLSGAYCMTGVARTERWKTYDRKHKKWVSHSKQICRSASRGAGRIARPVGRFAKKYGGSCLFGAATGALVGSVGGAGGAAVGAVAGCVQSVAFAYAGDRLHQSKTAWWIDWFLTNVVFFAYNIAKSAGF
jgi:RHS repeat-associated protein